MSDMGKHKLKNIDTINALLNDLYIDLRKKVNYWSSLTSQTSQARMGYIGQHLVSVVTGYQGGRSGARGKDLVLPNGEYGEIKTCSRVDQLGLCRKCNQPVSSTETECAFCGSTNVIRKDDSKWLISITEEYPSSSALNDSEDILVNISKPKYYYFVLFEFEDIKATNSPIVVTIYTVDPKENGFILCMLDYFYNIRKNAPFNMWPHMLKFRLCNPKIIYQSKIDVNGQINTVYFDVENPCVENFSNLTQYSRSKNLTDKTLINLCEEFGIQLLDSPTEVLCEIEKIALSSQLSNDNLIHRFANAFYKEPIICAKDKLRAEGKTIPEVFSDIVNSI